MLDLILVKYRYLDRIRRVFWSNTFFEIYYILISLVAIWLATYIFLFRRIKNAYKKGDFLYVRRKILANTSFRVQSHKFSQDNIQTTLVCSKCDEVFSKEFPLDLEGQTIEFKCPVCGVPGEADLPYKSAEEREELEEDFEEVEEEEGGEEFEEEY